MASIRRGDFHCSGWKHRRSVAACEVAGLAQFKNPAAPAVKREAEEDWGR